MAHQLTIVRPGACGNDIGANSDGAIAGLLTPSNPAKVLLSTHALAILCITDDGGLYVDETTPANEATADDVEVLPATPAVDDAIYFGHATKQGIGVDCVISTQGAGTWTGAWEYWDGSAWAALANVVDGTTDFTAAAGTVSTTWDVPEDWAQNTIDSVLGYWVRFRVATYDAVTTAPQLTRAYWVVADANVTWTDDTTDATDADAGDVALLPTYPIVGDAVYFSYASKFCKLKATWSQARTGTATITWEYWNGTTWGAISVLDDDTTGFSASAGTKFVHFQPPSDWAANTAGNGPNGQTGYFIRARLSAKTSVTQQPLGTQFWVLPLNAGDGIIMPAAGTIDDVTMNATTASATNADSKFLVVNVTAGTFAVLTWTKADVCDQDTATLSVATDDKVALLQITEDGTTEFADANFVLNVV